MSELQTVTPGECELSSTTCSIAVPLVLIADANASSRTRRARQLVGRGFRVAVARTAFEAIVKACCHLPSLILVDGSLGTEHADDATALLAGCPATAHIPIVRTSPGKRLPAALRIAV
jgi:CheY-like chemotaxis protein